MGTPLSLPEIAHRGRTPRRGRRNPRGRVRRQHGKKYSDATQFDREQHARRGARLVKIAGPANVRRDP
jgi:hypothetical protein